MRKFIIWNIVAVLVFISGCLGAMTIVVGISTKDSAEVAGDFLVRLEGRDYDEAYDLTSSLFRASQDIASMASHFDNAGVREVVLLPWRDRTMERQLDSDMRAFLRNGFGDEVMLWLKMAKEDGKWKVLGMADELRLHVGPGLWFQIIPSEAELRELTDETITLFAKALRDKDMTEFYEYMALAFRVGITRKQFNKAYGFLSDKGVDITGVADAEAVFDLRLPPASLDPDEQTLGGGPEAVEFQGSFHGLALIETFKITPAAAESEGPVMGEREVDILIASGYYPIEAGPVPFVFRYIYEHPNWKLFRVLVEEPDLSKLAPHYCIAWLLTQEVMDPTLCFQEQP